MPAWLVTIINFLVAYAPWIISVLSPLLVMKYRQAKKASKDAVDHMNTPQFVKDLLNSLDGVIEPVVKVVYVDYVEGMKKANADGKLTEDEIKAVNAAALAKFLQMAPKQLLDVLKKIYTPEKVSEIILDFIRGKVQAVNEKKEAVLVAQGKKDVSSKKFFAPPDKGFLE